MVKLGLIFAMLFNVIASAQTLSIEEQVSKNRQSNEIRDLYINGIKNQIEKYKSYNSFTFVDIAEIDHQLNKLDSNENESKPLYGIPVAVKDNILTSIYPTSNGLKFLQQRSERVDAPLVRMLVDNGAIIVGKANLHEFAGGITNENKDFGSAKNPFQIDYFTGGSSGGSALAVALDIVPFSIGSDTTGSVRIPASLCGVIGFRPTTGRYENSLLFPLSTSLDSVGIFAKSMDNILYIDKILSQHKPKPCEPKKRYRFALPKNHYFNDLNPQIQKKFVDVMSHVYHDGHEFVELEMDYAHSLFSLSSPIIFYEANKAIPIFLKAHYNGTTFNEVLEHFSLPSMQNLFRSISSYRLTKENYLQVQEQREDMKKWYNEQFRKYKIDAFIYPTTKDTARRIGTKYESNLVRHYIANTVSASLAELPSISVPLGYTKEGLPFGLGFDGQHGHDECLLQTANQIYSRYLLK